MKIKIICLLAVLLIGGLVASPNNYWGGLHCNSGKPATKVTTTSVDKVMMMIDDVELLPIHHFLNNF